MKKQDPNIQIPAQVAQISFYLRRIKQEQIIQSGKYGRNVDCPCRSGRRLKQCCWKIYDPFNFFNTDIFNKK